MSRREHVFRQKCAALDCLQYEYSTFSTLREYDKHATWRYESPYRCTRHEVPEAVVSPGNPLRQVTYVVGTELGQKRFLGGRTSRLRLGGAWDEFVLFVEDFPLGARVTITVSAEVSAGITEEVAGE